MFSLNARSAVLLLSLLSASTFAQDDNPCKSFGIDFQDGMSYFQNSLSTDPFTYVSSYEGCSPDVCYNILVDTEGNQSECSDTQLTPDDAPQLSTCPTLKDQMASGAWSVIMISNNGDAAPIAYQRDFNLTVAPQQTTTVTPTVTVPVTSTPLANVTSTVIDIAANSTLPAVTTYVASTTIIQTKTVVPARVTSTTTKVLYTINKVKPTVTVLKQTVVVTPTCTVPPRQPTGDPICRIKPTIGGARANQIMSIATQAVPALATATAQPAKRFRKGRVSGRSVEIDKTNFLRERSERMAAGNAHIVKRAPDQPTITVTDTNTSAYPTVTSTVYLPTVTNTVALTIMTTATITPPPVTVISGQATGPAVTVTAAVPTRVITRYTVVTNSLQKTYTMTITITSTTTPAASATACKSRGGHFGWL